MLTKQEEIEELKKRIKVLEEELDIPLDYKDYGFQPSKGLSGYKDFWTLTREIAHVTERWGVGYNLNKGSFQLVLLSDDGSADDVIAVAKTKLDLKRHLDLYFENSHYIKTSVSFDIHMYTKLDNETTKTHLQHMVESFLAEFADLWHWSKEDPTIVVNNIQIKDDSNDC